MNGLAVTDRESVLCSRRQRETNFAAFQVCKKIPGASLRVQKRSSHDDQVTGADHGLQWLIEAQKVVELKRALGEP
jgi:hypothetical protein